MGINPTTTLVNFMAACQPTFAYRIPEEDAQGNETDLYNIGQYPYDTWEKVNLSDVDFQVTEADTQDAGLVVMTSHDGNYLLPS